MTISKLKKETSIELLKKMAVDSSSCFILSLSSVSSNDINSIRRHLHESGNACKLVKNTLLKQCVESFDVFKGDAESVKASLSQRNLLVAGYGVPSDTVKALKNLTKEYSSSISVKFMASSDGTIGDDSTWTWYSALPTQTESLLSLNFELLKPIIFLAASLEQIVNLSSGS